METVRRQITEHEVAGMPLGRHVEHDPRSRDYAITPQPGIKTRSHRRYIGPLNQENFGSCTGEALTGLLATAPFYGTLKRARKAGLTLDQSEALTLYALGTRLDGFPGTFTFPPPGGQDTGSTGLAVCKGAQQLGLIGTYQHAFGLDAMMTALQTQSVIVGVNWYDTFDAPDSNGVITLTPGASIRGGHEFEVAAIDITRQMFGGWQSWGPDWGIKGRFWVPFDVMGRLLDEQGDCTVPRPLAQSNSMLTRLRHLC